MKKLCALILVMGVVLIGWSQPALAAEQEESGELAVKKLFRGIANAATGWMELFKQPTLEVQESGPAVGLTWGIAKGIGYAVARSVLGAYEIVTFPVPIPDGYKPIMTPEYVLSEI